MIKLKKLKQRELGKIDRQINTLEKLAPRFLDAAQKILANENPELKEINFKKITDGEFAGSYLLIRRDEYGIPEKGNISQIIYLKGKEYINVQFRKDYNNGIELIDVRLRKKEAEELSIKYSDIEPEENLNGLVTVSYKKDGSINNTYSIIRRGIHKEIHSIDYKDNKPIRDRAKYLEPTLGESNIKKGFPGIVQKLVRSINNLQYTNKHKYNQLKEV